MIPIVMISCAQRKDVRRVTLDQFAALNLTVSVLEDACTHPAPAEVLRNAWHALRPHAGTGALFCEDDIDLNAATFVRFVEAAVSAGSITTFCLLRHRLYPPTVPSDAEELPAELVPLRDYDTRFGFHGTMCVYLPPRILRHAVASRHEFMRDDGGIIEGAHGFDFWLKSNAREFGGLYAAVPNPVNHRPGFSTWGKQERWQDFQSTTYHTRVSEWRA